MPMPSARAPTYGSLSPEARGYAPVSGSHRSNSRRLSRVLSQFVLAADAEHVTACRFLERAGDEPLMMQMTSR